MLNFIQILIKMANISSARMTFLVGGFGLEIEICLNFNGFLFDATCFCFVIHFWLFFFFKYNQMLGIKIHCTCAYAYIAVILQIKCDSPVQLLKHFEYLCNI